MVKKLEVFDFMGDSPAAVLAEVLGGEYANLADNIEPTEDGVRLKIDGPNNGWLLTLRPIPSIGEPAEVSVGESA